jgi:hypothetical protein
MKKIRFVFLVLMVIMCFVMVRVVYASPLAQGSDPVDEIDLSIIGYAASLGLSFLTPFVVEILKRAGVVKDGMGGTWALVLNAMLFAGLMVLNAFGVDLKGDAAQAIIEILATTAGLILMVLGTFGTFKVMRASEVPFFRPRNS